MTIHRRALSITALAAGIALTSLVPGDVVAQSVAPGSPAAQRLTILQNGVLVGTLEVPGGLQVAVGTIVLADGQPSKDGLVRIGGAGGSSQVVMHIQGASVGLERRNTEPAR